jgi:hypothetical protein
MATIDEAWRALRAHLEARASELADEVRHYPGPIARCDDQLPALIEERARAWELARIAAGVEEDRAALDDTAWETRLARAAWMVRPRDAAGAALHGVLVEALRDRVLTQSPHIQ